jgi:hypothetical protein
MLGRSTCTRVTLLLSLGSSPGCDGGGGNSDGGVTQDSGQPDGAVCQPITNVLPSYDLSADATVPDGCWLVRERRSVFWHGRADRRRRQDAPRSTA